MAVDEVLLQRAADGGAACWRFYAWSEPTLSLGYFQDYAARAEHAPSHACPVVRRLTGGGAILHDAEITYSIAVPANHPWAARRDRPAASAAERLYRIVHGCLVEALAELGVAARLCEGEGGEERGPLLCFQRRAIGDVLLDLVQCRAAAAAPDVSAGAGAAKIAGSAQRRCQGAVLQHGSLLLRRSPAAPELPGLEDLLGRPFPAETVARHWLDQIERALGGRWAESSLTAEETADAAALVETRYTASAWTEKRRAAVRSGA
jgi:lipoate-protein ligase A